MPQRPQRVSFIADAASGVGPIKAVSTATYTLVPLDSGKYIRFTSSAAVTLTVPANSTAPIPIGAGFTYIQAGTGAITLSPAAGVTINAIALATAARYTTVTLTKVDTNTWDVR